MQNMGILNIIGIRQEVSEVEVDRMEQMRLENIKPRCYFSFEYIWHVLSLGCSEK